MAATRVARVTYATEEQQNNIELLVDYANVRQMMDFSSGEVLALESSDGTVQLTGLNTICRYIAGFSGRKDQLLGEDPSSQAQVIHKMPAQWTAFRADFRRTMWKPGSIA